MSVTTTLSDFERRDARSQFFFWRISDNYARVVGPGMTKIGVITQVMEKRVSKGSVASRFQGAGTQRPKNYFGRTTYAQTV